MRATPLFLVLSAALAYGAPTGGAAGDVPSVVRPHEASYAERLAAREIRRYLYVRTDRLVEIHDASGAEAADMPAVFVARKDRALARSVASAAGCEAEVAALGDQSYLLRTGDRDGKRYVLVCGGDDAGTLYAAYRLCEHLGVRFFLHGDVVPDNRRPLELPEVNEAGKPLFELRGIQPFHDFPEGPDYWNVDDYKAVISQLPKLGMNFIGLHTYPEGGVGPEPTVWIGLERDIRDDGSVTFSYPARHFTTANGTWGYQPTKTSAYSFGASQLFERDDYGAAYMAGRTPWPPTPQACNDLFNDVAGVLREAFEHARALGVKTCVGTETPLVVPKVVAEHLTSAGLDPAQATSQLYEAMFRRIAAAYPIDYYWFWTPENWTWSGATDEQVTATLDDLHAAIAAAAAVNAPFTLATCGWVLGPPQDRALFDMQLPKNMPMSCINRQVGKEPVEPGFARVTGRGQWAIPWLEDDPNLTSPQLWVGRMRRDAFDARRYGCTGLMGIHWRTRILGPNVLGLARAGWDQAGWSDAAAAQVEVPCPEGAVGGNTAAFLDHPMAGTDNDTVYQTVRYNMSAYYVKVPNGTYTVTLQFCEPAYDAKDRRAFGVEIQGKRVLHKLDIFARVGKDKALDFTYPDVEVTDGRLVIDFMPRTDYPCIAGLVIEGDGGTRRINCGGSAHGAYEADPPVCPALPRHLPADDFYADWARVQFGAAAGPVIARVFTRLDGRLPEPAAWVNGPGGIRPDARPWEEAAKDYAFVDEFAALRDRVAGPGYLERFDYWLDSFQYMRAVARLKCIWARYDAAVAKVTAVEDVAERRRLARDEALPIRKELIRALGEVYRRVLATVSTTGELGTVVNWEQHIQPMLLGEPGRKLAELLGEPLPADASPPRGYTGPARLIVPTIRTSLTPGEPLRLRAIVLSAKRVPEVTLRWRPMGHGDFAAVRFTHVARGVYSVELGAETIRAAAGDDLEYYVEARIEGGESLRFPASAPTINHTVVIVSPR